MQKIKISSSVKTPNRKPVYLHPPFVKRPVALKRVRGKRFWLRLDFVEQGTKLIGVVLKNPSRATGEVSDKTVFNVTSYIFKNRNTNPLLRGVGGVVILNLIPDYETYSDKLKEKAGVIVSNRNLLILEEFFGRCDLLIAAWGDAPKGLEKEYLEIQDKVLLLLKKSKTPVYYVDKLSKKGNPKHGQIWGYNDVMRKMGIKRQ